MPLLTDANVGTGTFTVAVTFSEAMNPAVAPAVSFTPGASGTLTFAGGSWSGNTYTATYNVMDANIVAPEVRIGVAGTRMRRAIRRSPIRETTASVSIRCCPLRRTAAWDRSASRRARRSRSTPTP